MGLVYKFHCFVWSLQITIEYWNHNLILVQMNVTERIFGNVYVRQSMISWYCQFKPSWNNRGTALDTCYKPFICCRFCPLISRTFSLSIAWSIYMILLNIFYSYMTSQAKKKCANGRQTKNSREVILAEEIFKWILYGWRDL